MKNKFSKIVYFLLCFLLIFEQSGFAQVAGQLDISGYFSGLRNILIQDKFRPLHLRYLAYDNANNNFKLLLDKGDLKLPPAQELKNSTKELLNYFFIGISLPNDSFWVNLRPDSPDNVIDSYLAQTDLGKILLEADLQLKKDTANFTSPQTPEGKEYWKKLYQKANELFGGENITIPTLTRPWIVPGEIIIRETQENAYVYKATLKVMLEQDYLKDSATYNFADERSKQLNEYASELIRKTIIPRLTKDVNTAKRYAPLRQVYYSLILAQWFKQKFSGKSGLYSQLIDKKNLSGLTSKESWSKDTYFRAYQKSFKEGEYNIKEPVYTLGGQTIRNYMSGGISIWPVDIRAAIGPKGVIPGKGPVVSNLQTSPKTVAAELTSSGEIKLQPQESAELPTGSSPAGDIQRNIDRQVGIIKAKKDNIENSLNTIEQMRHAPISGETGAVKRLFALFGGVGQAVWKAAGHKFDALIYVCSGADILGGLSFFDLRSGQGQRAYDLVTIDRVNIFQESIEFTTYLSILMNKLGTGLAFGDGQLGLSEYLLELVLLAKHFNLDENGLNSLLDSLKVVDFRKLVYGNMVKVEFKINGHTVNHTHFQYFLKNNFKEENPDDVFVRDHLKKLIAQDGYLGLLSKAHLLLPSVGEGISTEPIYSILKDGAVVISDDIMEEDRLRSSRINATLEDLKNEEIIDDLADMQKDMNSRVFDMGNIFWGYAENLFSQLQIFRFSENKSSAADAVTSSASSPVEITIEPNTPPLLKALMDDREIKKAFEKLNINQIGLTNPEDKTLNNLDVNGTLTESGVHIQDGKPVTTYRLTASLNASANVVFHEVAHAVWRNDFVIRNYWNMKNWGAIKTRDRGKLDTELRNEEAFCDLLEWENFGGIEKRVFVARGNEKLTRTEELDLLHEIKNFFAEVISIYPYLQQVIDVLEAASPLFEKDQVFLETSDGGMISLEGKNRGWIVEELQRFARLITTDFDSDNFKESYGLIIGVKEAAERYKITGLRQIAKFKERSSGFVNPDPAAIIEIILTLGPGEIILGDYHNHSFERLVSNQKPGPSSADGARVHLDIPGYEKWIADDRLNLVLEPELDLDKITLNDFHPAKAKVIVYAYATPKNGPKNEFVNLGQLYLDSLLEKDETKVTSSSSVKSEVGLFGLIKEKIDQSGGKITFAEFMGDALNNKKFGYSAKDLKLGLGGDFTTDAQNPRFAAKIADQILQMWIIMGKPADFQIVEMGAGTGMLARNILSYLSNDPASKQLYVSLKYVIVEINERPKDMQIDNLKPFSEKVVRKSLEELNNIQGIFLSNELVDAFPVHIVKQQDGRFKEVYVTLKDGRLTEEMGDLSSPELKAYTENLKSVAEGQEIVFSPHLSAWQKQISRALDRGFVITIDYGVTKVDDYAQQKNIVWSANKDNISNPRQDIYGTISGGRSTDITWLINFKDIVDEGDKNGLKTFSLFSLRDSDLSPTDDPGKYTSISEDFRVLMQERGVLSSSPLEQKTKIQQLMPTADKGGIDFRGLPITVQPMLATGKSVDLSFNPNLVNFNLNKEWAEIENMLKAGIVPSSERIKEYLQSCCQKKEISQEVDKILACIADILRLQEERVVSTDLSLKEMLALLESDKPVNEMQLVLAKIIVEEKEPELIAQ